MYSVAFCILTRGRCLAVQDVLFAAELDGFVVVIVDVANVDAVESNNNCCTCNISTYSSRPAELFEAFNLEAVHILLLLFFLHT